MSEVDRLLMVMQVVREALCAMWTLCIKSLSSNSGWMQVMMHSGKVLQKVACRVHFIEKNEYLFSKVSLTGVMQNLRST